MPSDTMFLFLKRSVSKYGFLKNIHLFLRSNLITSYFYNLLLHRTFIRFFPDKIFIDASTICNLHCVLCPTGKGKEGLTKGFLKFSKFKMLVDEVSPHIKFIFLSNWGEIFLNPEIFEIINYAQDKGMIAEADSNLNYFNENMAKKLIKSKIGYLNISIDGASQKTYSAYRKGGSFNRVIHNLNFCVFLNSMKPWYIMR